MKKAFADISYEAVSEGVAQVTIFDLVGTPPLET